MIWTLIFIILAVTAAAALLSIVAPRPVVAESANQAAAAIDLVLVLWLLIIVPSRGVVGVDSLLLVDPFGVWVLVCLAVVYLFATVYARGYLREQGRSPRSLKVFYSLFACFALIMILSPIQNNPGLYWVGIDLTTLVSAVLVGLEPNRRAIEAAWKYLVVVAVGLSLALIGTILFYFAGTFIRGENYPMTWASFEAIAPKADPSLLLVAFLLVLVGFGTKAGLAPMHTWLPDAHSEGPTPVSVMLSGGLLNCAMLGIVRYLGVLRKTSMGADASRALVILGVASLVVAALFITRQRGIKRLAAYSSVEHIGIIALGFGFGGVLGTVGALYQMLNHSLTKSAVFFGAGNAIESYGTRQIAGVRRIADRFPVMGAAWLAAAVAAVGAPPFGLFLSELTIARGGIVSANPWAVGVMGVALIVIFIGFMGHFRKMFFAGPRHHHPHDGSVHALPITSVAPMLVAVTIVLVLGVWWPHPLWIYFTHIAATFGGR
ncbi:proton-conducting transporter membrane subunit [Ferrimicrobium acidiphilum]|jgi:hydrogenase-4 component F|uniref:Hydrogenase-4 component B n=1 Tax=Ferrimicrobium acidiphilum DSM 19497 TaxID=1121877 RepID=A0A0D8FRT1_9ACTN|nr:proton-conducting transporter membrane subunit [Ferrimicrobium acidiphilum]KJE75674.1 hydrogenase-4 component B [Ferrimicrobium acidiphilum DSM 19497]